jgi:hypothetical protein
MWYLDIIVIVILVALPVIVRLRTGAWGNGKRFRETWSTIRNAPARAAAQEELHGVRSVSFWSPIGAVARFTLRMVTLSTSDLFSDRDGRDVLIVELVGNLPLQSKSYGGLRQDLSNLMGF